MKPKSEIRNSEARKKPEIRKSKTAVGPGMQTLQSHGTETENFGFQSADFFRISSFELRISAESTSLKQFNSEF